MLILIMSSTPPPTHTHIYSKQVFWGHLNILEKVSLHDRCPFVTSSLTWGRYDTVIKSVPRSKVSSHQRVP